MIDDDDGDRHDDDGDDDDDDGETGEGRVATQQCIHD